MTENSQNAIRSYRPGGWYAIFGEHASVLLPASEKPRVAALWELVDSGSGFDELLDALIATGLRSLPGFVLVSTAEEPTRLVLRGAARAEVTLSNGEQTSVDGGAAATWVEKALSDVASLQLVLEDDGEAVDFGIRSGLVRVSRIDQPPYAANSASAAGSAAAEGSDAAVESDSAAGSAGAGVAGAAAVGAGAAAGAGAAVAAGGPTEPDVAATGESDVESDVAPDAGATEDSDVEPEVAPGFAPTGGAYAAPVVGAFTSGPIGGAHAGESEVDESAPVDGAQMPDGHDEQAASDEPVAAEAFAADQGAADPGPADEGQTGEGQTDEGQAGEGRAGEALVNEPLVDEAPAGFESAEGPEADDRPTEAHAFPFFNDPEEPEEAHPEAQPEAASFEVGQPEPQPEPGAGQAFGDQPAVPDAPDAGGQASAPSEPAWGQAPQGHAYAPPEPPSNPFAPGAAAPEPPMWEPPAQPEAPQWDAPAEQSAGQPSDAPAWGEQPEQGDMDHDGHTQAGSYNPGEFARQHPGIPGQPPAPSVTAQPVARLAFSNGDVIDVDRAVLVGRAPEARRFTSTDQPRLVTVTSPNQEISSTHLEVRPGSGVDHGSAIVTDMGSTNGTVLTQPGFAPEDLQPGIAVQLLPGSVIDLGDGVTIQVTSV